MEEKIFPDPINKIIDDVIQLLTTDENFFTGPDISAGYSDEAKIILKNLVGDYMLPKFFIGEELVFDSEDDFEELLKTCAIETAMLKLMGDGLIWETENIDGEKVYGLTEKGIIFNQKLEENEN